MEIWRDIEGYEGRYQISNRGRVKSLTRNKIMRLKAQRHGYKRIGLRTGSDPQKFYMVHRLVAQAFVPNPNNKAEVNHIDGDKANNTSTNLQWVTTSENALHAYKLGLRKPTNGTINGQCKLTESDVFAIRKRVASGETQRRVAQDYDISFQTVNDIVLRKRWAWLD